MSRFSTFPFYTLREEDGGGGGGGGGDTFTKADLEAAVAAGIADAVGDESSGLKGQNFQLIGKVQKAKPILDAVGDRSAEEIKAAFDFQAEAATKKAEAEGDFKTLKEQMATNHATELGALTDRTTVLEGSLFAVLGEQAVTLVLDDPEIDGSARVMLPHITPFVKVIENANATSARDRFRSVVVDSAGKERVTDGAGTPMTLRALVEEFRDDAQFSANFGPGTSTGSDARNTGGGSGKAHSISRADAQDPAKYRAASAAATKAGVGLTINE